LQAKIELVTAKTIVTGPGLILSGSINSTFFGSTYGILSDWEINIAGMSFNFSYNTKSLAKLEENFLTPFSTIIKRNFFNYGGSIPKIKFYNGSYINFYWLFNESGSGYPTPDIKLSGNT
jgi:hypothetical protein